MTTQSTNSRTLLGLACAACTLTYAWLASGDTEAAHIPEAPAVFTPRTECPVSSAPGRRAERLRDTAAAKLERYPFAPSEGAQALSLLSEAARCSRAARGTSTDPAIDALFRSERQHVDADYREHRSRLARALETSDHDAAAREAHWLSSLLTTHDDEYTRWLRHIEQDAP